MIRLKRVYERAEPADGRRFLVERLWPRGVRKNALKFEAWVREAAPSHLLRRWFNHDPVKWEQFRRRYFAELDAKPGAVEPLLEAASRGTITLLYSSHDTQHNNAVALKQYLENKMSKAGRATARVRAHAA